MMSSVLCVYSACVQSDQHKCDHEQGNVYDQQRESVALISSIQSRIRRQYSAEIREVTQ